MDFFGFPKVFGGFWWIYLVPVRFFGFLVDSLKTNFVFLCFSYFIPKTVFLVLIFACLPNVSLVLNCFSFS